MHLAMIYINNFFNHPATPSSVMSKGRVTDIKLVVVGDAGVGKTCLLFTYFDGAFPVEYVPTVYDISWKQLEVDGQQCLLKPWDTAGKPVCY